jgi:hypothetical protein
MNTLELTIPTPFISALINSDTSGLSDEDEAALDAMIDFYLKDNQCFHAIDTRDDCGFLTYHDMREFGVLASDCETVVFDIGGATL